MWNYASNLAMLENRRLDDDRVEEVIKVLERVVEKEGSEVQLCVTGRALRSLRFRNRLQVLSEGSSTADTEVIYDDSGPEEK